MDPRPFSYNVLKHIIGHMTIEQRINLAMSCPEIRNVERKAELQLDQLSIDDSSIEFNHLLYSAFKTCEIVQLGDNKGCRTLRIHHERSSGSSEKEPEELMQLVTDCFLADRNFVKVCTLNIHLPLKKGKLPEGLKIECKELSINGEPMKTVTSIYPFLTNSQLRKFTFHMPESDDPISQEELVQKVHCLEINKYCSSSIKSALLRLRNSIIIVNDYSFLFSGWSDDFLALAESWLVRRPAVGTRFELRKPKREVVEGVMTILKNRLGAEDGEIQRNPCVTIHMKSGDELNVFGNWLQLRMEVMQRGSSKIVAR